MESSSSSSGFKQERPSGLSFAELRTAAQKRPRNTDDQSPASTVHSASSPNLFGPTPNAKPNQPSHAWLSPQDEGHNGEQTQEVLPPIRSRDNGGGRKSRRKGKGRGKGRGGPGSLRRHHSSMNAAEDYTKSPARKKQQTRSHTQPLPVNSMP
jgi:hypothetical protein